VYGFFLFVFTWAGCDSSRLYETNTDFEDRSWKIHDTAQFEFSVRDLALRYNLSCNLRNSLDYPYSRIFITYHLHDSIGKELETNMISAQLFDQKTGTPFGSSAIGDLYDHRIPLLIDYEFKQSGKYKVRLEQFMRKDTLPGILAVGLRVEKRKP